MRQSIVMLLACVSCNAIRLATGAETALYLDPAFLAGFERNCGLGQRVDYNLFE